jgi:predicted transglutaminase-like protease
MHNHIPSASIRPVAIIYEENDQYYLAPLDEPIKINEIVKEFVENIL